MEEEGYGSGHVSFVTCAAWAPHGVAKSNPDKVEMTKEELARVINEMKEDLGDLEGGDMEEEELEEKEETDPMEEKENVSTEDGKEVGGGEVTTNKEGTEATVKKKKKKKKKKKEEEDEDPDKDNVPLESRYDLEAYDKDSDARIDQILNIGRLAIHASSDDDPFITIKDADDKDSEDGDHEILPTDNLLAVGHVEQDAASLEVYVYNAQEGNFYCHHDILLPDVPLCMEWLNYDPTDEQLSTANMLAIGSMSPVIQIWDLDIMDSMECAYSLGKKGKKKKKIPGVGHSDAVLSLSWNKYAEHVLASGSVDKTVILWDLEHGTVAQQMKCFEDKVQGLEWHHKEPHTLLTGSGDGYVRMFDCNIDDSFKSWKLDGEVECVIWDKLSTKPYNFLASTDKGTVFAIDGRQDKPMWSINAHTNGCTALRMSPQCPGCLVTVSVDEACKIWDITDKPELIEETKPKVGLINCLSVCPDSPFVFCMGGDNKENPMRVWDIRQSRKARSRFCSKIGLPADDLGEEDEMETSDDDEMAEENYAIAANARMREQEATAAAAAAAVQRPTGTKPKKFGKKKGGHLERRRKKH